MKILFWLLDPSYEVVHGEPQIKLWGIDGEGRRVLLIDHSFKPYFYVLPDPNLALNELVERIKVLSSEDSSILNVEVVDRRYYGRPVKALRITCKVPASIPVYREKVASVLGVREVLEADIRFYVRYIIDHQMNPCGWHEVEVEEEDVKGYNVEAVYRVLSPPKPIPKYDLPRLRLLAFDIECYNSAGTPKPHKDPVIIISTVTSGGGRKQFLAQDHDDGAALKDFIRYVQSYDPDVIAGYNSNGFDWPYLIDRVKNLGLAKLAISREGSEPQRSTYGHISITGRASIDLLNYAEDLVDVKVKTLDNVADYLGVMRKDSRTNIDYVDIAKYWDDAEKRGLLLKYAMEDAVSTYGIAEKVIPFAAQLASITGMPLDQVLAASVGFRVEHHIMRNAFLREELIPNRVERPYSPYRGAIVLKPKPGIHENIAVIDFSAMYPHLMIKYNIGFDSYIREGEGASDYYVAPEVGHRFVKDPRSLYGSMLQKLIEARQHIREAMKGLNPQDPNYLLLDNRQRAIKVLANASYGYLGWVGARFYVKACAEATTAYGRYMIAEANKLALSHGLEVIYSDTDSIFVRYDPEKVNRFIRDVEEKLELEVKIDKLYRVLFFTEAAKKYAGLTNDGLIDVVGFEAVRGDWCALAQEVQTKVLEIILRQKNVHGAVNYVKDVIRRIRRGETPLKELIIWKTLTREFEEYEVEAAHITAAKMLLNAGYKLEVGDKVGYVVVKGKGERLADRVKPYIMAKADEIDYEYYAVKQVVPSALRILKYFGVSEGELVSAGRQATLFDFSRR